MAETRGTAMTLGPFIVLSALLAWPLAMPARGQAAGGADMNKVAADAAQNPPKASPEELKQLLSDLRSKNPGKQWQAASRLADLKDRSVVVDLVSLQGDIWVMKDNGTAKVQLTDSLTSGCCTGPTWFPDGRYIAYWSEKGNGGVSDKLIWVMTADGTHKACVMDDNAVQGHYKEYDLRINKAGTRILFGGEIAGVDQIMVLDLDTADTDRDGLKNWQEDVWGSSRKDADSNDDGIRDGDSVLRGIDPVWRRTHR